MGRKNASAAPAYEFICEATDCQNNDLPSCDVHVVGNPVRIGKGGHCPKFTARKEPGKKA